MYLLSGGQIGASRLTGEDAYHPRDKINHAQGFRIGAPTLQPSAPMNSAHSDKRWKVAQGYGPTR